MGKILVLALLMCSGCTGYNAAMTCQDELGPAPTNTWGQAFGVIGALASTPTDEAKAYDKKFDACMGKQKAANP